MVTDTICISTAEEINITKKKQVNTYPLTVAEDIAVADVLVPAPVLVRAAVEQDAHKRTQWLRHANERTRSFHEPLAQFMRPCRNS